jgi:hypothetical protein
MEAELDPYRVLGVDPSASLLDIARARRRLAKRHHPDLTAGDAAAAEMARINAAWRLLSDPEGRADWDRANGVSPAVAGTGPITWTEWAYAPAPIRRPSEGGGSHVAWWVLGGISIFLILIVGAGILSTLDRPDGVDPAPWLQENLDR